MLIHDPVILMQMNILYLAIEQLYPIEHRQTTDAMCMTDI